METKAKSKKRKKEKKATPIFYLLHVPGVEPDPSNRRLRVHGRYLLPRRGVWRLRNE